MTGPLLEVRDLSVVFGNAQAVFGVSLEVEPGRALAVLGANGAGKSSLARAICGLTPRSSGSVNFAGVDITRSGPSRIARMGLAYLPEGRGIFPGLSVNDNLRMFLRSSKEGVSDAIERAYDLFPRLKERRRQTAGTLSGGEQQMLALARVLAGQPKMVIADEPSLGLAPKPIDMVFDGLRSAREAGVAVVLIEQYVHRALEFADDVMILRRGLVTWSSPTSEVGDEMLANYLGQEGTSAPRS